MYRQFMESQMLDISHEPMEVAPTAHYTMGGVVIAEPETQATAVAGLYAVGEVTTGLHGANRLGGNSLAEIIVFGKRAGEAAATYSQVVEIRVRSKVAMRQAHDDLDGLLREGDELARPLQRALRDTLWECCGVMRSKGDRLTVTRSPVPPMPTELASWADTSPPDLSLTGRLLE